MLDHSSSYYLHVWMLLHLNILFPYLHVKMLLGPSLSLITWPTLPKTPQQLKNTIKLRCFLRIPWRIRIDAKTIKLKGIPNSTNLGKVEALEAFKNTNFIWFLLKFDDSWLPMSTMSEFCGFSYVVLSISSIKCTHWHKLNIKTWGRRGQTIKWKQWSEWEHSSFY